MNKNVKELVHLSLTTCTQLHDEDYMLSEMLLSLCAVVAQCCCMKDKINSGIPYGSYSINFVGEFQLKCQQLLFRG